MRILVIGGGGREHALVRALKLSKSVEFIACAPGNGGIALDAECVDIFAHSDIANYCRKEKIDLVVVGPEEPLVGGLADRLTQEGIAVFGPSEAGAQIEASKAFTKELCRKYGIPTAAYASFENQAEAIEFAKKQPLPVVVKADGLAAGKGVTVCASHADAINAITDCFDGVHGQAGQRVVIEEFLDGDEVSVFALCDGTRAVMFGSAQDHKRAYDNDRGPNTGGMGSFSPTPLMNAEMEQQVMRRIITPTIEALAQECIRYQGVLFAGLMLTADGPKLIEYNCRFGDPETQSILARYDGDLAKLLLSCANGAIDESQIRFRADIAVCVVMANAGYPGKYEKGAIIGGLERAGNAQGVRLLHAGTIASGEQFLAYGGRVLNIIGTANSLRQARMCAYEAVDMVDWATGFCRRDIGARVQK